MQGGITHRAAFEVTWLAAILPHTPNCALLDLYNSCTTTPLCHNWVLRLSLLCCCLQVVDVPDSMQEVLVSCFIFYAVRLLVNRLAAVLPAPPAAGRPRRSSSHLAAAGSGGGGSTAEDAAVGSPASVVNAIKSEEQEGEGIKYEGYAEAIAAAQVWCCRPGNVVRSGHCSCHSSARCWPAVAGLSDS
jgi:hypothetical protein